MIDYILNPLVPQWKQWEFSLVCADAQSKVIWVSVEIRIWTPPEKSWNPLENVGSPLKPWKSIVFF